ncbi:hypothetical protein MRX96_040480 [Rhipicephalus microplus]
MINEIVRGALWTALRAPVNGAPWCWCGANTRPRSNTDTSLQFTSGAERTRWHSKLLLSSSRRRGPAITAIASALGRRVLLPQSSGEDAKSGAPGAPYTESVGILVISVP